MTGKYIYVKRKTVRRIAALTVFLVVVAVTTMTFLHLFLRRPVPQVETSSCNALTVGGSEVAYFRNIDADTVFTGLTLNKDSIHSALSVNHSEAYLKVAVANTVRILSQEVETMEAARKEMDYYIGTHGVQDEGYEMVVSRSTLVEKRLATTEAIIETLARIADRTDLGVKRTVTTAPENTVRTTNVALECFGGKWTHGRWLKTNMIDECVATDGMGRTICARRQVDTICSGWRADTLGIYQGQMDRYGLALGHGCYESVDGTFYEGHWHDDMRSGFGFSVDSKRLRAGEWKNDKFQGERMFYTSDRIYGIDISKYQHGKGRKRYSIAWNRLRISHLGSISRKTVNGVVDYPVSFVYIKSTEGTSIRNPYFHADYRQARQNGFRTGAYHFFSVRSSATAQANYFVGHSKFSRGDMPPVLDVEPTDRQINQIGGTSVLFSRIRTWMNIVGRRTGVRPVLYVSQRFVNKYLSKAPDLKRDYNVWIARYGEYKPDVKLVYWQLCPDGRVLGIHGEVDINVFNGYHDKFKEFVEKETIR